MRHAGRRSLLAAALTCLIVGAALWFVNPRRTRVDLVQHRATGQPASIGDGVLVGQTFTPRKDGLEAIEIQFVLEPGTRPSGTLTAMLEAKDEGLAITRLDFPVSGLDPDGRMTIRLPCIQGSAHQQFQLTLGCSGDCGLSLVTSATDSLADGHLTRNGAEAEGDLYLTTYYAETFRGVARETGSAIAQWAPGVLALIMVLAVPGLASMLLIAGQSRAQPMARLALVLTCGLAFWPLTLLWCSTLGLRLGPRSSAVLIALLAAASAAMLWRYRGRGTKLTSGWDAPQVTVLGLTILAVVLRLIQARNLLVPAWVDSVHHTMLTTLVTRNGTIPVDGRPYVQVDTLHYHYGFHAVAAAVSWLSRLTPAQSVLVTGQVLSGLAGLPLYALTTLMGEQVGRRRPRLAWRWAGAIASAVPAYWTYMPAYYVSWGRYTQLAGLVMLPVLLALTWRLASRWNARRAAALALLVGGLALTHYRVLFYYALFCIPCSLLCASETTGLTGRWIAFRQALGRMLLVAVLSLLLIAPWVAHMASTVFLPFEETYGSWIVGPSVGTALPVSLLTVGSTEWLLLAAALGFGLALARRQISLLAIGIWAGLCVLVSDPGIVGLSGSWFVQGTSAAISYWLPAGFLTGALCAGLFDALVHILPGREKRIILRLAPPALASVLLGGGMLALWTQADVVNTGTVLVQPEDMVAIAWAREHLPEHSLVLINTEPWQPGLPMGSDAGVWLPYLADCEVTYPAVLYTQGPQAYKGAIRALAEDVQAAQDLNAADFVARLAQAGVTHVFVGARGGPLMPERLQPDHYVELFRHGATRIYRLDASIP